MNTIILTSYPDFDYEDTNGNKIPQNFGNKNGFLDYLKLNITRYKNFLYIASSDTDYNTTDYYADICFKSFDLTLPFENYYILDGRNISDSENLILNSDFIFVSGGHVPTQNKFFNKINLKELLEKSSATICGGSAGSMNMSDNVYCPPELPGEATDPNFERYYKGLGLVNINILPHFNEAKDTIVDNKKFIEEIILPDSYNVNILALNDGSYLTIKNDKIEIFGEAYIIVKGNISQICKDNSSTLFIE